MSRAALAVTLAAVSISGHSVRGAPIHASEVRGAGPTRSTILVVGCIHGNEPAGIAVARRLLRLTAPRHVAVWVVPSLNPDGVTAGTRGNAHGVDLNRNFPWQWHPLHGLFDSGPRPLSEPESRFAASLIERVRPRITIWFHQHENVVDESGGDVAIERRFARLAGMQSRRLPRYPGSAIGWENRRFPGTTSFVVELPPGRLSPGQADRLARAVLGLSIGSTLGP